MTGRTYGVKGTPHLFTISLSQKDVEIFASMSEQQRNKALRLFTLDALRNADHIRVNVHGFGANHLAMINQSEELLPEYGVDGKRMVDLSLSLMGSEKTMDTSAPYTFEHEAD